MPVLHDSAKNCSNFFCLRPSCCPGLPVWLTLMDSPEGFPDYTPTSNDTGAALYIFVVVYSVLSFLLIAPFVIWARNHEKRRQEALNRSTFYNPDVELTQYHGDPLQMPTQVLDENRIQNQDIFRDPGQAPLPMHHAPPPRQHLPQRQTSFGKLFQELDRVRKNS